MPGFTNSVRSERSPKSISTGRSIRTCAACCSAVQKALPLLAKGFSVILTGSIVSIKGFPSFPIYNASKVAVRSFARSWILDPKGCDIRIIATPGYQPCDYASRVSLFGVKWVWRLPRL